LKYRNGGEIMNTNLMAMIGITGGLLCAVADLLLDLKGPGNKKLGKMKVIDSMWKDMTPWRFVASIICAMFAVPMYTFGFWALMNHLGGDHHVLAVTMKIIFTCGAMGGFMIHTFLCCMPTIYRDIMVEDRFELAEKVILDFFRNIYVPFFGLYTMLVIIPAIAVMMMIGIGILPLPLWTMIMNPLVIQIIGLLFRATKLKCFIDAPSCCAASIGLACYGVLALMI